MVLMQLMISCEANMWISALSQDTGRSGGSAHKGCILFRSDQGSNKGFDNLPKSRCEIGKTVLRLGCLCACVFLNDLCRRADFSCSSPNQTSQNGLRVTNQLDDLFERRWPLSEAPSHCHQDVTLAGGLPLLVRRDFAVYA